MAMEVAYAQKDRAWRGRGHPRRTIPQEVAAMADRTYGTGHVGVVTIGADDEEDATELVRLLRSYAKSLGRIMRIQRDDDVIRFELADKPGHGQEAAA